MKIKRVLLQMDERLFKRLKNAKEEAIVVGDCKNWEEYILKACKIIK